MTPKRWQQINRIYYAALDLAENDRASFLEQACHGDEELRLEVESLLTFDARVQGFLGHSALQVTAKKLAAEQVPSLIGQQIGPYKIVSLIGSGGMGEVYRASDTRLNRLVAIKVLPSHLSTRPDIGRRFEREARAISNLSHPHICTLYDIGHQDDFDFLVMEYLEGETLAQRLKKGLLPPHEVLHYGIQIGEALAQAHRHGVVHRDLKPGNIMLTQSGAKLLDFGLAKMQASSDPAVNSPLALAAERESLTSEGLIVGTLEYMAPEQLEGKEVDTRTDIFAFGLVIYEMVTGRAAFIAESKASLIVAILSSDPPPMTTLQPLTPPVLEHVVKMCLAKNPDDRWQSSRDLTNQLKWIAQGEPKMHAPASVGPQKRKRDNWVRIAATLILFLIGMLLGVFLFRKPTLETGAVRFTVPAPGKDYFYSVNPLAVSPDGRHLAVCVDSRLWVRPINSLEAEPLPGTAGAASPFWSPDGHFIGFFGSGTGKNKFALKKTAVFGQSPQVVCEAAFPFGGSWNAEGLILFGSGEQGILRVSANGGAASPVTQLDPSRQETGHFWPTFLPDGHHFLYLVRSRNPANQGIYVGSIDSNQTWRLVDAESNMAYAPSGYLVYLNETNLSAQPFDAKTLTLKGEPAVYAEQVLNHKLHSSGYFSVSESGSLAFMTNALTAVRLIWHDRAGLRIGSVGPAAEYNDLEISPDEKQVAVEIIDPETKTGDIRVIDLASGVSTRVTETSAWEYLPLWSPDGTRILYTSNRNEAFPHGSSGDLHVKSSDGAGSEELVLRSELWKYPSSWSRDGRFILFYTPFDDELKVGTRMWFYPFFGDRKPMPFLQAGRGGQFSPEARWVAYSSDESGTPEIYVTPFPSADGKWKISDHGGLFPRWRGDGRELFYLDPAERLMAAYVKAGATFATSSPKALFQAHDLVTHRRPYAVAAQGQRFLMITGEYKRPSITMVVNWTADLPKR